MKIQVLQEELSQAVSIASRFANSKAQLPILGNILFSASKTKLFVVSTNLEISVSIGIGAKVEESGELAIPSKTLNDLVSYLPKAPIDLSTDKEQLKVKTDGFSSNVLGMASSDFPKVPNSIDKNKALVLPAKDFVNALSQVTFAVSQDETRPVLTGVLVVRDKKQISLVATDGFRLSRKTVSIGDGEPFTLILPKLVLTELGRDFSGSEDILFDFNQSDKQAVFGLNETILTSRILEGEYPDYEKIIPKNFSVKVSLDKEDLFRAVKLAAVFAREASNIVKIKVLSDSVKVFAESGSSGSQEMSVDAKVEKGEGFESGFEVSFNYKFIDEFISSVKGEEVSMEFSGVTTAGVFKDTSDAGYLHLIMPVRVQG